MVRAARDPARVAESAALLLRPSIQVNSCAERFPEVEANGVGYLKIPGKPTGLGI